jgi:hypothetical protein
MHRRTPEIAPVALSDRADQAELVTSLGPREGHIERTARVDGVDPHIIAAEDGFNFRWAELPVAVGIEYRDQNFVIACRQLRRGKSAVAIGIALLHCSVNDRPEQLVPAQSTVAVRVVLVHEIVDVVAVWDAAANHSVFPHDHAVVAGIRDVQGPIFIRVNAQRGVKRAGARPLADAAGNDCGCPANELVDRVCNYI